MKTLSIVMLTPAIIGLYQFLDTWSEMGPPEGLAASVCILSGLGFAMYVGIRAVAGVQCN